MGPKLINPMHLSAALFMISLQQLSMLSVWLLQTYPFIKGKWVLSRSKPSDKSPKFRNCIIASLFLYKEIMHLFVWFLNGLGSPQTYARPQPKCYFQLWCFYNPNQRGRGKGWFTAIALQSTWLRCMYDLPTDYSSDICPYTFL